MKPTSILLLKVFLVLIAVTSLAAMIRFPQTEGRAANLDLISIYTDPFIIYMYIASIPFFIGLQQAFKLLTYANNNTILSKASAKAVRNLKYCALILMGFIAAAISYIFVISKTTNDDGTGAIVIGLIAIFVSGVIAIATSIFQKRLYLHNT